MKKMVWLIAVLLVLTVSFPVMAEEVLVPITKLGLAPWLGEIKDEKDLAEKFAREKAYFAGYIQYDLEEAAKLEVTSSEAREIVNAMESAMRGVKDTSVPDETVFKSMGWKSKKGNVMRTKNPILKLGKPTKGFPVKVEFKDYEIEYVFLKDCGNLCLRNVKSELPPKAEYVPQPKEEVPPPKAETPPPRYAGPPQVDYYSYNYYPPPPPSVYEYSFPLPPFPPFPPFPFFFYDEDRYDQGRGYQQRGYQHRGYQQRDHQSRVRPPTVHTRPPVHSTPRVRPPGVRTR